MGFGNALVIAELEARQIVYIHDLNFFRPLHMGVVS